MELSEERQGESNFSRETKHQMLEEFVVAYYNGTIRPNLAEKDAMSGRDVEFLMDGPQFERTNRSEVWSYSGATGTGYQYRVTYKDKRFSGIERLLGMYSGSIAVEEDDKPVVEQRLYEILLLLIKEGRLPREFKLRPAKDLRIDRLNNTVEILSRAVTALEERVRSLEEARQQVQAPVLAPASNNPELQ